MWSLLAIFLKQVNKQMNNAVPIHISVSVHIHIYYVPNVDVFSLSLPCLCQDDMPITRLPR